MNITSRYLATVKKLVEAGNDPDNIFAYDHETYLHFVCRGDDIQAVAYLVEHGANVNLISKYGQTPLYCAITGRSVDVAKYLLDNGADINTQNINGSTVLHWAAVHGFGMDGIKMLLDYGVDKSVINKQHMTADELAHRSQEDEIAEYIREYDSKHDKYINSMNDKKIVINIVL